MKRIPLLIFGLFIFSIFGFVFPSGVKAACYKATDAAFSICDDSPTRISCGLSTTDGFAVCCDGGTSCPADTPGGKSQQKNSTCGQIGQACCTTGPECETGTTCNRDLTPAVCNGACGSAGQLCCPNQTCLDGSTCGSNRHCQGGGSTNKSGAADPASGGANPIQGKCKEGEIDTAIGCVPISDQNALINFILKWGIGIGGGIAFLLILAAGFQIMTSRGDPNRLKAGQELMTSAIAGLLLMIFSIVILRIIGVDILGIKGLIGG